jgi:hypothetical protein
MNFVWVSLEVLNGAVGCLLLYGLLFSPDAPTVFGCLFFASVLMVLGQITSDYLLNHVQTSFCIQQTSNQRLKYISECVYEKTNVDANAVYLLLMTMMYTVVIIGFYRLYVMLSREKGFV